MGLLLAQAGGPGLELGQILAQGGGLGEGLLELGLLRLQLGDQAAFVEPAAVVEAGAQRPLELQEAEASASVPSENEAAAGLLSTPSAKDSEQDGAAPEREDVTLWSN